MKKEDAKCQISDSTAVVCIGTDNLDKRTTALYLREYHGQLFLPVHIANVVPSQSSK